MTFIEGHYIYQADAFHGNLYIALWVNDLDQLFKMHRPTITSTLFRTRTCSGNRADQGGQWTLRLPWWAGNLVTSMMGREPWDCHGGQGTLRLPWWAGNLETAMVGRGVMSLALHLLFPSLTCWLLLSYRYMVTFSPLPDNKDDPQAIIIWDIVRGIKKRGFHCESASVWPIFKWVWQNYGRENFWNKEIPTVLHGAYVLPLVISVIHFRWNFDGQYFARMTHDTLSIYETPVSFLESCLHISFCWNCCKWVVWGLDATCWVAIAVDIRMFINSVFSFISVIWFARQEEY